MLIADAPIRAPATRRDNLRTICGPSESRPAHHGEGVDWFPFLAELDIEFRSGTVPTATVLASLVSPMAPTGSPARNGLARSDVDSDHSRQDDMITIASIQYQELPIGAKRSGIENRRIRGRRDDGSRLCCNRVTLARSAGLVGSPETAGETPRRRERKPVRAAARTAARWQACWPLEWPVAPPVARAQSARASFFAAVSSASLRRSCSCSSEAISWRMSRAFEASSPERLRSASSAASDWPRRRSFSVWRSWSLSFFLDLRCDGRRNRPRSASMSLRCAGVGHLGGKRTVSEPHLRDDRAEQNGAPDGGERIIRRDEDRRRRIGAPCVQARRAPWRRRRAWR